MSTKKKCIHCGEIRTIEEDNNGRAVKETIKNRVPCPKCGNNAWEIYADGWTCTNCGYLSW